MLPEAGRSCSVLPVVGHKMLGLLEIERKTTAGLLEAEELVGRRMLLLLVDLVEIVCTTMVEGDLL